MSKDGRTVTEYALSVNGDKKEWRENVTFSLTEGHFAVCGAYEGETLILAQNDGTVFIRDVVVKEMEVEPQGLALWAGLGGGD